MYMYMKPDLNKEKSSDVQMYVVHVHVVHTTVHVIIHKSIKLSATYG